MTGAAAPDPADATPEHDPAEPAAAQPRRVSTSPALAGFAWLLGCQLAGEMLARSLGLPWPGPVLGLIAVAALLASGVARTAIGAASQVLLQHLSLLFVPVGVGVITHLDRIAPHGLPLAAVLVLSTWIGIAATALVLRALRRRG